MLAPQRDPPTRGRRRLAHDLEALIVAVGILAVILAICVLAVVSPGVI